jgi:hypothetical protein
MSQIKNMVDICIDGSARDFSPKRRGLLCLFLDIGRGLIVTIRAPLFGDQYLTLLFAGAATDPQLLCAAA